MAIDYGLMGAGVGLLPWLAKQMMMPGKQATAAQSPNFQGTGLTPAEVAAVSPDQSQAIQAANYANSGGASINHQNTIWQNLFGNNAAAGSTSPTGMATAAPATPAGTQAANPFAALSAAFGGANAGAATGLPTGATTMPAPVMQHPNYAGTGPNMAAMSAGAGGLGAGGAVTPAGAMTAPTLPSGGPGAPLGPAAGNPLLAILRQRLGLA